MSFIAFSFLTAIVLSFIGLNILNHSSQEANQTGAYLAQLELEESIVALLARVRIAADTARLGTCPAGTSRRNFGGGSPDLCLGANAHCVRLAGVESCLFTSSAMTPWWQLGFGSKAQAQWQQQAGLAPVQWGGTPVGPPQRLSAGPGSPLVRIQVPTCAAAHPLCFSCGQPNTFCFRISVRSCRVNETLGTCVGPANTQVYALAYSGAPP